MTETQLKNKVLKWIKLTYPDAFAYKTSDQWHSGIPDILIVKDGTLFAIELKVGKNTATRLQLHVLRQIAAAGGVVGVCYNLDEVKGVFE